MQGVLANPDWSRLVLWHALEATPEASKRDDFAVRMGQIVDSIRARQEAGELDGAVDPRFIGLLAYAITFAPLSIPDHLRGLTGHDPASPEYRRWAAAQLAALLAAPASPTDDDTQ